MEPVAPSPSAGSDKLVPPRAKPAAVTGYVFWNMETGEFLSGREDLTPEFLERFTKEGWQLELQPPTAPLPLPTTHEIIPEPDQATGKVKAKVKARETPIGQDPVVRTAITKWEELTAETASAITSGFLSTALAEPGQKTPDAYFYPGDDLTQRNILLGIAAGGGLQWCRAPDGVWARRPHTEDQLKLLAKDFVGKRDMALTAIDVARTDLVGAKTVDEIEGISVGAGRGKP